MWTGRPSAGLLFTSRDIFLVPFSLVWCGFAIFWESSAAWIDGRDSVPVGQGPLSNTPTFFLLFGGAFVLVGLYFVFGRFIVDA